MIHNKHIIILLIGLLAGFTSCKDWEEINTDPKNPTEADAGFLLAYAQKYLSDQYNRQDVNNQPGLLLAQYWAQGPYPQISRYDYESRNLSNNLWLRIYTRILKNFRSAKNFVDQDSGLEKEVKANQLGIITAMEVFTWQWLVDIYGDVPYTGALTGGDNPTPEYDDAKSIYEDLLKRLDTAIDNFDGSKESFGNQDIIYGGDVSKWIKFANSLKIRVAMRLIDVEESMAKAAIEEASANVFVSNEDNAILQYLPGSINGHPHYFGIVQTGRDDYAVSQTLTDVMNDFEDPRRKYYMTAIDDKFVGLEYGKKLATSDLSGYSHVHPDLLDATAIGVLMTYSELEFLLAEAAEIHKIAVGGTGEDHYNKAITASIMEYGGTADEASTYLANSKVTYSSAEGGDKKKAIAIQKWISLYKNGFEGWSEWRRLDYPILHTPQEMTYEDIPVRIKYPNSEQTLNGTNYQAAAKNIGGDNYSTNVFWDVK